MAEQPAGFVPDGFVPDETPAWKPGQRTGPTGRPIDPDATPSPLLESLSHLAHPTKLGDFLGLVLPSGIPPLAQMLPASVSRAVLTGTRGVGALASAGARGVGGLMEKSGNIEVLGTKIPFVKEAGGALRRAGEAGEYNYFGPQSPVNVQPAAPVSAAPAVPTFAQQVRAEAARTTQAVPAAAAASTPTFAQQVRTEAARSAAVTPAPSGDMSFADRVRAQAQTKPQAVPRVPTDAQARAMERSGRATPYTSEGGPGRPTPVPLSVAAKEVRLAASEGKIKLTATEFNEAVRYAKIHPTENVIEGVLAHRALRESASFADLPSDADVAGVVAAKNVGKGDTARRLAREARESPAASTVPDVYGRDSPRSLTSAMDEAVAAQPRRVSRRSSRVAGNPYR